MSGGTDEVWDAGLQPERTALAWRRTALALTGAGLVLPRILGGALGWWVVLPSSLVIVAAALLWWEGHRRYRTSHASLTAGGGLLGDGRVLVVPVVACLVIGMAALAGLR